MYAVGYFNRNRNSGSSWALTQAEWTALKNTVDGTDTTPSLQNQINFNARVTRLTLQNVNGEMVFRISEPGFYVCEPYDNGRTGPPFGMVSQQTGLGYITAATDAPYYGSTAGRTLMVDSSVRTATIINAGTKPLYLDWDRIETVSYPIPNTSATQSIPLYYGYAYPLPPGSITVLTLPDPTAYPQWSGRAMVWNQASQNIVAVQ